MLKTWRAVHPTDKQAVANDAGFSAVLPCVLHLYGVALKNKGGIRKIQLIPTLVGNTSAQASVLRHLP